MITKIVIDTNIVFSAFLNYNSRIGQILLNVGHYDFYAPEYIRFELIKHREKIKTIAHISDKEFLELYDLIMSGITILNHSLIPSEFYTKAKSLCMDIDIDDTIFVAFSDFIGGKLWTGDKKLLNGLRKKGFVGCISTDELFKDFLKKEVEKK